MQSYFKNTNIIKVFNIWKKQLIIIGIAAGILGIVISFLIPPLYKSSAVLYPVNLPTMSSETTTEQMLQIIQSVDIQKKMFDAFKLGEHYKLKSNDPYYFSNLLTKYSEKVFFKRTEYDGIAVTIYDRNPKFACNMVDSLIKFYNDKVGSIHKQKNLEMVKIKGEELANKKKDIDSLEALQRSFRLKYGIFNVEAQGKELTRGMVSGSRDMNTARKIDTLIHNINERAGELNELNNAIWLANQQYNAIKDEYDKNLTEVNKKITYCLVVESPFVADKKSSPNRIMIVLVALFTTIAFAILTILYIENRKVKKTQ